jgi:hypothetical protein
VRVDTDAYPWRCPTSPEVSSNGTGVPAGEVVASCNVAEWPPEHWTLAFQGQRRVVSGHDAQVIVSGCPRTAAATAAP